MPLWDSESWNLYDVLSYTSLHSVQTNFEFDWLASSWSPWLAGALGVERGGVGPAWRCTPLLRPLSFSISLLLSLSLSLSAHNSKTGWLPGARIVSAHSGRAGEWKPFYISISICLEGCGMAGCAMAGCDGGRGNSHRLIHGGVTQYGQRTATASGLDDVDDV